MPRIFNSIRKQLATDKKFLQYSRYAIGEILLVVVGILIALQIDNWNDERINRQDEVILIKNILQDLNDDREITEQLFQQAQSKQNVHLNLYEKSSRKLLGKDMEPISSEFLEFINLMGRVWDNHRNSPELLSDLEIRNSLNKYLSVYQKTSKYVGIGNDAVSEARIYMRENQILDMQVVFGSSPDKEDFDPLQLVSLKELQKYLGSAAFNSLIVELYLATQDSSRYLKELLIQNKELHDSLHDYLDKLNNT